MQMNGNKKQQSTYWDAWQITQGSSNVTVAVIDNGIDLKHPENRNETSHVFF